MEFEDGPGASFLVSSRDRRRPTMAPQPGFAMMSRPVTPLISPAQGALSGYQPGIEVVGDDEPATVAIATLTRPVMDWAAVCRPPHVRFRHEREDAELPQPRRVGEGRGQVRT